MSRLNQKVEEELIAACVNGNERARKMLYEQYKSKMMGLCMRYAKTREEAQDLLQEGFIKVFRDLHQYRPIRPLNAWMRKVMVNTALEHIRRNKRAHEHYSDLLPEDLSLANQYDEIQEKYNAAYIVSAIQQLSTDYRLVFNLFAVEGYSHKEIAQMLGITEGASKVRLLRAKAALQNRLKEQQHKK